jgi:hypothetical protein
MTERHRLETEISALLRAGINTMDEMDQLGALRRELYAVIAANPTKLKSGTRIEIVHSNGTVEAAVIARWTARVSGPQSAMPGYHALRGEGCLFHETHFRVVDNRAA